MEQAWRTNSPGGVDPSERSVCVCRSIKAIPQSILDRSGVHVVDAEAPVDDYSLYVHREDDLAVLVGLDRAAPNRIGIDEARFEAVSAVLQRLRGSHGDGVDTEIRVVHQCGRLGLFVELPDLSPVLRLGIFLK